MINIPIWLFILLILFNVFTLLIGVVITNAIIYVCSRIHDKVCSKEREQNG